MSVIDEGKANWGKSEREMRGEWKLWLIRARLRGRLIDHVCACACTSRKWRVNSWASLKSDILTVWWFCGFFLKWERLKYTLGLRSHSHRRPVVIELCSFIACHDKEIRRLDWKDDWTGVAGGRMDGKGLFLSFFAGHHHITSSAFCLG